VDSGPPDSVQRRLGYFAHKRFPRLRSSGGGGFDPISLICKVSTVEGRTAVKLSDNYAKALGTPAEIDRYRRVFGTAGITNAPLVT